MLSRELIEAVKERIELDHSKEEIMTELEGAGYDHDMIEEVYQTAQAEFNHPTPEQSIPTADTTESKVGSRASTSFAGYGDLMRAAKRLAIEQRDTLAKAIGLVFVAYAIFGAVVAVVAIDLLSSIDALANNPAALSDFDVSPTALLLLIPLALALVVYTMNVRLALLRNLLARDHNESFRGSLSWGWRHLIAFIVISFFISMATQFGYLLLVIPGIALALYVSFSSYVLVDENERGLRALIRSTELVYGRWWSIVGRYLAVMLLLFGVLLGFGFTVGVLVFLLGIVVGDAGEFINLIFIPALLGIGLLIFFILATWYTLCFRVVLYESLKASAAPQPLASDTPRKLRTMLIVFVIGGVGLTIFNTLQEDQTDPRSEFGAAIEALELQQDLLDAKSQTERFIAQNELDRYTGLCNEILPMVSDVYDPRCFDGEDAYALYAEAGGQMWCFDSTGFNKEIQVRPNGPSCLNTPPSQPATDPGPTDFEPTEAPSASQLATEFLAEGDIENALLFTRIQIENTAAELGTVTVSEYSQVVSTRTVTVTGIADNRPTLNALRTETQAMPAVASVALPLDDMTVATDIPFTMVVTLR